MTACAAPTARQGPLHEPPAATVIAQFYDVTGRSLGTASVTVAPGTRQTINVNAVTNNVDGIHSTVLTSASPFVAEQPQYYGGVSMADPISRLNSPSLDGSGTPPPSSSTSSSPPSCPPPPSRGSRLSRTLGGCRPPLRPRAALGASLPTSSSASVLPSAPSTPSAAPAQEPKWPSAHLW